MRFENDYWGLTSDYDIFCKGGSAAADESNRLLQEQINETKRQQALERDNAYQQSLAMLRSSRGAIWEPQNRPSVPLSPSSPIGTGGVK